MAEIAWLVPWYPTADEEFSGVLRREMGPGHVLEAVADLKTIARRQDNDDVLFLLGDGRVAIVHLTWRDGRETDGRWPATRIDPSLDEFVRTAMAEDHALFTEDE